MINDSPFPNILTNEEFMSLPSKVRKLLNKYSGLIRTVKILVPSKKLPLVLNDCAVMDNTGKYYCDRIEQGELEGRDSITALEIEDLGRRYFMFLISYFQ